MRRPLRGLWVLLFVASPVAPLPAGAAQCDPDIRPVDGRLGYAARPDRCEGLYISEISASALEVVSITPAAEGQSPRLSGDAVAVHVLGSPAAGDSVHLLARGRQTRTYYQMDTGLLGPQLPFLWNVGILTEARLAIENIGILAFTEDAVGRRTYFPTALSPPGGDREPRASPGRVLVSVRTNVDTESVVYRCVSAAGEADACSCEADGCRLGDWNLHDLPGGQVPAGDVIEVGVTAQRPFSVDIAVMPRDSAAYRAPLTIPVGPP